ncbi:MAG TPA: hypothetical protein VMS55_25890 [Myxococcota bacterium]|nr:hypothetical protein [Myxococcota bacterium]
MRVYILRFQSDARLQGAFDRVIASPHVASCMVESAEARIRFLAPAAAADALVHEIYLEGGLVWCSRHDVATGLGHALVAPEDARSA